MFINLFAHSQALLIYRTLAMGQPLSKENFFPKVVKYYYLQSNSFMNSCMDKKKPWFDFLVAFYHLDLEHCNSISKAV